MMGVDSLTLPTVLTTLYLLNLTELSKFTKSHIPTNALIYSTILV